MFDSKAMSTWSKTQVQETELTEINEQHALLNSRPEARCQRQEPESDEEQLMLRQLAEMKAKIKDRLLNRFDNIRVSDRNQEETVRDPFEFPSYFGKNYIKKQ